MTSPITDGSNRRWTDKMRRDSEGEAGPISIGFLREEQGRREEGRGQMCQACERPSMPAWGLGGRPGEHRVSDARLSPPHLQA